MVQLSVRYQKLMALPIKILLQTSSKIIYFFRSDLNWSYNFFIFGIKYVTALFSNINFCFCFSLDILLHKIISNFLFSQTYFLFNQISILFKFFIYSWFYCNLECVLLVWLALYNYIIYTLLFCHTNHNNMVNYLKTN